MTEDVSQGQPTTAATSQPAATMLEPDFHPFAAEFAQQPGQPEPGASAPDAERVPEAAEPTAAPTATEGQPPEPEPDFRAAYAELQRKVEEAERARAQEREQFETQQKQWLEFQQRENERKAEEQRKAAEQDYKTQLKAAYDRAVSADDDEQGLAALDQFVREGIAAKLAAHFQQQSDQQRAEYEKNLTEFQQQARQQLVDYYKPGFAQQLVQQYGLPESAAQYLMTAPDVDQMPAMAEQAKALLAQAAPQMQQQAIQQQVEARRQSGVHAVGGVSGGPLPPTELKPMAADSKEAIELGKAILGIA